MRSSPSWIHGAARDTAIAWCWVPFVLVLHGLEHDRHLITAALSAVLLLSLTHQTPTLAMVYGDPERFGAHRRLYLVSPLVAAATIAVGLTISFALVAVIAGLWNAEHTLLQRYGLTRIYGRKAGDDHGRLEKPMLLSWLGLAMVVAAANRRLPKLLARVELGDVNRNGVQMLSRLRPEAALLIWPALAGAAWLTLRWVASERRRAASGEPVNSAKYWYLAAFAALIVVVCIDPLAGFGAYVGAHAVEYFVIVHTAVGRRARAGGGGLVGRLVRWPTGAVGFCVASVAAVVGPLLLLDAHTTFTVATTATLSVGALHIFYDGFIWKLRMPAVARDLAAGTGRSSPASPLTHRAAGRVG